MTPQRFRRHAATATDVSRVVTCLVVGMFVLATSGYGSGSQSTPSDDTPPVPLDGLPWPGGGSAVYLHRQMVVERTAADRLQRFPDSPHTVAWLSQAHRLDDALRVLERVVQRQPERLPGALTGLDTSEIQRDQARGYRARARSVLDHARKKLPGLDRERAAAMPRLSALAVPALSWRSGTMRAP